MRLAQCDKINHNDALKLNLNDALELLPEQDAQDIRSRLAVIKQTPKESRQRLCEETRDSLLTHQDSLILSFACYNHAFQKLVDSKVFVTDEWTRFGKTSRDGHDRLVATTTVCKLWGTDVVNRYRFVSKSRTYCNILRIAAKKVPEWEKAVDILNCCIYERSQAKDRRTPMVGNQINPIEQCDLEKMASGKCPYDIVRIPKGYGRDDYGLLVRTLQGSVPSSPPSFLCRKAVTASPLPYSSGGELDQTSRSTSMPLSRTAKTCSPSFPIIESIIADSAPFMISPAQSQYESVGIQKRRAQCTLSAPPKRQRAIAFQPCSSEPSESLSAMSSLVSGIVSTTSSLVSTPQETTSCTSPSAPQPLLNSPRQALSKGSTYSSAQIPAPNIDLLSPFISASSSANISILALPEPNVISEVAKAGSIVSGQVMKQRFTASHEARTIFDSEEIDGKLVHHLWNRTIKPT